MAAKAFCGLKSTRALVRLMLGAAPAASDISPPPVSLLEAELETFIRLDGGDGLPSRESPELTPKSVDKENVLSFISRREFTEDVIEGVVVKSRGGSSTDDGGSGGAVLAVTACNGSSAVVSTGKGADTGTPEAASCSARDTRSKSGMGSF